MTKFAASRRLRVQFAVATLVTAVAALVLGANAHLAYVAFRSQPDCVAHLKSRGAGDGEFRAAKSAC